MNKLSPHPSVVSKAPAAADVLRQWVEEGASLYVCGSLQGMAKGVDDMLRELLGSEQLQALAASGRYRRDVY